MRVLQSGWLRQEKVARRVFGFVFFAFARVLSFVGAMDFFLLFFVLRRF
uniref:Uncharacterized protein n=1 Tax=Manihot esculenta TaxID=3983 RepID=A0A2C9VAJ5_MANES